MKQKNVRTLIVEQENRNPYDKDSVAYRLRHIIHKRRYTAKEVSALTEDKVKGLKPIHPATLSLYINGKSVPNISYTRRLAKTLKVDPSWLSCNLPFEYENRSKETTDMNEMIDVYTRLDVTWQRCILATARMILLALQYGEYDGHHQSTTKTKNI